jgi:hypothetical protein
MRVKPTPDVLQKPPWHFSCFKQQNMQTKGGNAARWLAEFFKS